MAQFVQGGCAVDRGGFVERLGDSLKTGEEDNPCEFRRDLARGP